MLLKQLSNNGMSGHVELKESTEKLLAVSGIQMRAVEGGLHKTIVSSQRMRANKKSASPSEPLVLLGVVLLF